MPDQAPEAVRAARAAAPSNATFVAGDFLALDLPEAHFDLVAAVASLHHMDQAAGLAKMARLLAPGGRLVVVGLARSRTAGDRAVDVVSAPVAWMHRLRLGWWEPDVPVAAPVVTWARSGRRPSGWTHRPATAGTCSGGARWVWERPAR